MSESRFDRITEPVERLLIVGHLGPVDHDPQVVPSGIRIDLSDHILDKKRLSIDIDSLETLTDQQRQLLDQPLSFAQSERHRHQNPCTGRL